MSKLGDIRFKAKAAANRIKMEREAALRLQELENSIRQQVEDEFQRKEARQITRDTELREKYPALKDAYEQYQIILNMCDGAEPKRKFTPEEFKIYRNNK